eukprot:COSAG01_NODE_2467_length_7638_cov_4.917230_2_plen_1348_part_01
MHREENEAALKVLRLLRDRFTALHQLEDSGHPFFQNRSCPYFGALSGDAARGIQIDPAACSVLEQHVTALKTHLTSWKDMLKTARSPREMSMLQLLSNQDIALIIHLLSADDGVASILGTLLGCQSDRDIGTPEEIDRKVCFCLANLLRPVTDLAHCKFGDLNNLDTGRTLRQFRAKHKIKAFRLLTQSRHNIDAGTVNEAARFTIETLRDLLDETFDRVPDKICRGDGQGQQFAFKVEQWLDIFGILVHRVFKTKPTNTQILWCSSETSGQEINLFFQRIMTFRSLDFVVCAVDMLSQTSWEHISRLQRDLHRNQYEVPHANVYYVSLAAARRAGSMDGISGIKEQAALGRRVSDLAHPRLRGVAPRVTCLVGKSGDGKTHVLRRLFREHKQRGSETKMLSLIDSVDSSSVSRNLADLEFHRAAGAGASTNSCICVNISDVVETRHQDSDSLSVTRDQFFYDVNRLFFEAVILGYTCRSSGGASFALPDNCHDVMNVVVEVPAPLPVDPVAHSEPQPEPEEADEEQGIGLLAMLPVLQIVGATTQEVGSHEPYELTAVDRDVAAMINALHTIGRWGPVIDNVNGDNVLAPVATDEQCRRLIYDQLTKHDRLMLITDDHRERRELPDGRGCTDLEYFRYWGARIAESKLLQKCFLAYLGRRAMYYTSVQYRYNGDPRLKLGSTSAKQFIREAIELCDNAHKIDDRGEYLLLGDDFIPTLLRTDQQITSPDLARIVEDGEEQINERLGTTPEDYLRDPVKATENKEGRWAYYLARGLGFATGKGVEQVASVLEQMQFVMVSDFCFKLIHIHERKLAQLPVVIEGETGVGKTYLLDCYSQLLSAQATGTKRDREEPPNQVVRICRLLKKLGDDIELMVAADVAPSDGDQTRSHGGVPMEIVNDAMMTLAVHSYQLENETISMPGTAPGARKDIAAESHARQKEILVQHWQYFYSIGCDQETAEVGFAMGQNWLSAEVRDTVKAECIDRLCRHLTDGYNVNDDGSFDPGGRHQMGSWKDIALLEPTPTFLQRAKDFRRNVGQMHADVQAVTSEALSDFLDCSIKPLFYRYMVHPGVQLSHIKEWLQPIRHLATTLLEVKQNPKWSHARPLQIIVFFDEVNTARCQGLFKEILCDKCFEGKPLPDNMFFIAAINPERREEAFDHAHLANLDGKKPQTVKTIHRDVYNVHKMQPALDLLKWQYTKLSEENLNRYINDKVTKYSGDVQFSQPTQRLLEQVINRSQTFMIERLGESSVSQRDVQRCFKLVDFFQCHAPQSIRDQDQEMLMQAAVALATSVAYYFRLPTDRVYTADGGDILELRKMYVDEVAQVFPQFEELVDECFQEFSTREHFE